MSLSFTSGIAEILPNGFDLNALVRPGFFSVDSAINAPDLSNYLVTVQKGNVAGNSRVQQLATRTANGKMYLRVFTGVSGWTTWQTLGGGTGSSPFLDRADLIDDNEVASTDTYFYFGWINVAGSWLVRRQERATALTQDASTINNALPDLATAWPLRETLTYA